MSNTLDVSSASTSDDSGGLRICQVIGSLRIGGAERQVVNLANELPAGQAEIIVLDNEIGPLGSQLKPSIEVRMQPVRWLTSPIGICKLARLLRRLHIDVLQTHMFWANLYGTMAGRLAGVPVIVTTEHGKNTAKPRWARWLERQLISRLSDRRICVSEDIRMLRIFEDGVPEHKLCVIANGTPVQDPLPLVNRVPITIGTIGRLIDAKDFRTLIEAVGIVHHRGVHCRLVVVGGGPEFDRLHDDVVQRKLQNVVELAGFSNNPHSWLEQFDIYVISSIREGQPLSMLEAMAVGLPIIATEVGGIPDTVRNGEEALLVPPRKATAIAEAIIELTGNLPLRQRLGAAARRRMLELYSTKSSMREHLKLFRSLLRHEDSKAG